MLIIVGKVDVNPTEREEYLKHADEAVLASRAEPGCLEYVFAADRLDPARINVYERWTDMDAVKAHIKSDHMAAYRAAVAGLTVTNRAFVSYEVASERVLG